MPSNSETDTTPAQSDNQSQKDPSVYNSIYSAKENNDPILELYESTNKKQEYKKYLYKSVYLHQIGSQDLLTVTIKKIRQLKANKKNKTAHITFLNPIYLYRTLHHKTYKTLLEKAFLNLSTHKGVYLPFRNTVSPYSYVYPVLYVLHLIRLAEAEELTLFIIGKNPKTISTLINNLKRSYPKINIVGKLTYVPKQNPHLIEALRKTNPDIVLFGLGYYQEIKWLSKYKNKIGSSLILCLHQHFDNLIRPTKFIQKHAPINIISLIWSILKKPLKWYQLIQLLLWFIESLSYLILSKNKHSTK